MGYKFKFIQGDVHQCPQDEDPSGGNCTMKAPTNPVDPPNWDVVLGDPTLADIVHDSTTDSRPYDIRIQRAGDEQVVWVLNPIGFGTTTKKVKLKPKGKNGKRSKKGPITIFSTRRRTITIGNDSIIIRG